MLCSDRTLSTISSVNRVSHADLASRSVPLTTPSLFQKLSGTNVPQQGAGSTAQHDTHQPPSYRPEAARHRPPCPAPRPRTQNFARNSFARSFNNRHKRCNSNDRISMFERCARELRARLLGNHGTTTVATTPSTPHCRHHEARRPRPETRGLVNETTQFR